MLLVLLYKTEWKLLVFMKYHIFHLRVMLFKFIKAGIDWVSALSTSVKSMEETQIPKAFSVLQNYPNPFNPTTKIEFSLPYKSKVLLEVFDVLGRKVAELINEEKSAGTYEVNFDAKNLSSGILYISNFLFRQNII